jgi:hypothetical protein
MLTCMLIELLNQDPEELTFAHTYIVFFVKFPCAIALHFALYPEVAKGMEIMKFANNDCEQFVQHGSEIGYCIGLM